MFKRTEQLCQLSVKAFNWDFDVKRDRHRVERIQVFVIKVIFDVLEELVFGCYLLMALNVVNHLHKAVREPIEVDASRQRDPFEVEVALLVVLHLHPQIAASLLHYATDNIAVVPVDDLILKQPPSLLFNLLRI